jgi:uncharacterized protein (TIGR03089 family)
MTASTLPDLIAGLLSNDPARPLVTFYDDDSGERVELSVKTFENWVAKTANLLQGTLSADPGDHVALWLPTHWQTAVWVCAAAACGVTVSTDADAQTPADVAVCGPESLSAASASGARDLVALSLRPMGQGFDGGLPEGATDYAREVLGEGDSFLPLAAPDGDGRFLVSAEGSLSQRELLDRARTRAGDLGLHPGGRLLTDANPAREDGMVGGLLAAMVTGGSVVLTRHADPAAVDGRVAQEQVTVQWWADG